MKIKDKKIKLKTEEERIPPDELKSMKNKTSN
jgi:hypothetical protein